ncbi:MAG TPA: sigma-70 family RNA polymerase sigma factor [Nitrospira sp.]|nr:sigma-70 family RNA polymerase sigma factor [Nitrospira sp.]
METTHGREDSEARLLTAAASGELTAFESLYRLYETRVYRYVLTLVDDQTTAEDVTGETMIAVWRGAGGYTRRSRVSTWIFGIARHKALDALRRLGRRHRDVDLETAADIPSPHETPLDDVHRKQVERAMQSALAALSPDHREVLRLVFYEELPYDEIGSLLSIPANTVKTRVFYAKQQLKRHLERLGQKEPIS